jgi:glycosyltransferase involved in cell wall biosynthesis
MKVLMVAYSGSSGLGYYSCQLCRELASQGAEVTLLTNQSYHLDFESKSFEVLKLFSRTRNFFFELPRFITHLSQVPYDIIHFQSAIKFPPVDYLLWKRFRKRKKLIYTVHDVLPHETTFYDPILFRKIYSLFDALIVHSLSNRDRVLKEFRVDQAKLHVIPHGIYDIYKSDPYLTQDKARTGIEHLLQVFCEISAKGNKIHLLIAGSGLPADNKYYLQLIDEANRSGSIIHNLSYIPFDEVQNYFMASDFVVLPYTEGSTSGVLKLAYAFDKPVITTGVGDLSDMVKDGETGFIIPASEEKALEEKMLTLLNDDGILKTMTSNIRHYKQQFDWATIADKTIGVYNSVLKS